MRVEIKGDIEIKKGADNSAKKKTLAFEPDVWLLSKKPAQKLNMDRKSFCAMIMDMAVEKIKLVD